MTDSKTTKTSKDVHKVNEIQSLLRYSLECLTFAKQEPGIGNCWRIFFFNDYMTNEQWLQLSFSFPVTTAVTSNFIS